MTNIDSEVIRWDAPYTNGKLISFRPPVFEKYNELRGHKYTRLISALYVFIKNQNKSFIDSGIKFNRNYKSLTIEGSSGEPSIEFYFNKYIPILHALVFDFNAETYEEYNRSRIHYLLTITENLIINYKKYNDIYELPPIHNDKDIVYQIKVNTSSLYCMDRDVKFLSIDDFFAYIEKKVEIDHLYTTIERLCYLCI